MPSSHIFIPASFSQPIFCQAFSSSSFCFLSSALISVSPINTAFTPAALNALISSAVFTPLSVIVYDNQEVDKKAQWEYFVNIEKLTKGMPLQHITHTQEFMKMDFYVDENVLIPRQDTEILVEEVIRILKMFDKKYLMSDIERENNNTQIFGYKKDTKELKVLDMCTGSGSIAISIAKYVKESIIDAVDISKKALDIVQKNAKNRL